MKHVIAFLIFAMLAAQPCHAFHELPPVFDNPEWLYYEFNIGGVRDKYPLPGDYDVEAGIVTVGVILGGPYLVGLGLWGFISLAVHNHKINNADKLR